MIKIEVCANSIRSAIEGEKGGASRIELCHNLSVGGLTPSIDEIRLAKQSLKIDLNILIRPRQGDFHYNNLEFRMMKKDIQLCGINKCNGVVFGILNGDRSIDIEKNKALVAIAKKYKMSTTFHRAFDESDNFDDSLEKLIGIGFDRILTSGGKQTAMEGKYIIRELIQKAAGQIIVMPGAGVTENNIAELARFTKATEIHGSFSSKESERVNMTCAKKVKNAIANLSIK